MQKNMIKIVLQIIIGLGVILGTFSMLLNIIQIIEITTHFHRFYGFFNSMESWIYILLYFIVNISLLIYILGYYNAKEQLEDETFIIQNKKNNIFKIIFIIIIILNLSAFMFSIMISLLVRYTYLHINSYSDSISFISTFSNLVYYVQLFIEILFYISCIIFSIIGLNYKKMKNIIAARILIITGSVLSILNIVLHYILAFLNVYFHINGLSELLYNMYNITNILEAVAMLLILLGLLISILNLKDTEN